jgi:hypothetical protein
VTTVKEEKKQAWTSTDIAHVSEEGATTGKSSPEEDASKARARKFSAVMFTAPA